MSSKRRPNKKTPKNKTNKQWVNRHINDPFVKKAQGQGYRSRAVYKLDEIQKQDKLFKGNLLVADLGSAPGGWSQYIMRNFPNVEVIALDLLEMEPVQGVEFIQGDFNEPETIEKVMKLTQGRKFDLVISDIAPNITGVRDVDNARYEVVLDAILYFCELNLKTDGRLLVKLFEGGAAQRYRAQTKKVFQKNAVRKPVASRPGSKELYFLSTTIKAKLFHL